MDPQLQSTSSRAALLRLRARPPRNFALVAACVLAFAVAGCPKGKINAKLPKIIPPVPAPVEPLDPPYILGQEPADLTLAMIPESLPAPPPERPHPTPRKPPADIAVNPKPATPVISPEISPSDQQAYQRRIKENIETAQKNLQQASQHQLNATQKDMAEKIKGFVDSANEAMQASDWTRAQNLAQKAQVLSAELVGTL